MVVEPALVSRPWRLSNRHIVPTTYLVLYIFLYQLLVGDGMLSTTARVTADLESYRHYHPM